MRLFIAIVLKRDTIRYIDKITMQLKANNVNGIYTRTDNIHITLSFLGEVDENKVDDIKNIMSTLNLCELKEIIFDEICNLKDMIIIKIRKSKELNDLYMDLNRKLFKANYLKEVKDFFPHITLIRETKKVINKQINLQANVQDVVLFESKRINQLLNYIPK